MNKKVKELQKLLAQKDYLDTYSKLETLFPDTGPYRRELYPKHVEFINSTSKYKRCTFMAANRVGKSFAASFIVASALQGIYPKWYKGHVWDKPVKFLCACNTNQNLRDVWITYLFGAPGQEGTGLIKKENIVKLVSKPGTGGLYDFAIIRGKYGDSHVYFRSYEQNRESYQGLTLDAVFPDEEPPSDHYSEMTTRVMTTQGHVIMTYTPLGGMNEVTMQVLDEYNKSPEDRKMFVTRVTWDDVPHITEEMKEAIIATYRPWEIEARTKGIPSAGVGACYPIHDDDIKCDWFDIPKQWPRWYGLDYGHNRTAAVFFALDPNTDVIYIYDVYVAVRVSPTEHVAAIKERGGEWMYGISEDALTDNMGGGHFENLYSPYLNLVRADKKSVVASIDNTWKYLAEGKLKVFSNQAEWFKEKNTYQFEENGKINSKVAHDIQDATRYGMGQSKVLDDGTRVNFRDISLPCPEYFENKEEEEVEHIPLNAA